MQLYVNYGYGKITYPWGTQSEFPNLNSVNLPCYQYFMLTSRPACALLRYATCLHINGGQPTNGQFATLNSGRRAIDAAATQLEHGGKSRCWISATPLQNWTQSRHRGQIDPSSCTTPCTPLPQYAGATESCADRCARGTA